MDCPQYSSFISTKLRSLFIRKCWSSKSIDWLMTQFPIIPLRWHWSNGRHNRHHLHRQSNRLHSTSAIQTRHSAEIVSSASTVRSESCEWSWWNTEVEVGYKLGYIMQNSVSPCSRFSVVSPSWWQCAWSTSFWTCALHWQSVLPSGSWSLVLLLLRCTYFHRNLQIILKFAEMTWLSTPTVTVSSSSMTFARRRTECLWRRNWMLRYGI